MKKSFFTGLFLTILILTHAEAADYSAVDIHGFISQGYLKSDHNNFLADTEDGTFQFNEMGINFTTSPAESLYLGIQFLARDIGDTGNDKIEIDWAYADYKWYEWLGFRVGKIKLLYGFYNESRDIDMLRTPILLPPSVYSESARDAQTAVKGISVYGNIDAGPAGLLTYQAMYGVVDIDSNSGTVKLIETLYNISITSVERDEAKAGAIHWHTPLDGLKVGVSLINTGIEFIGPALTVDYSTFESKIISAEYLIGNLTLSGEYHLLTKDTDTTVIALNRTVNDETKTDTYYINAAYRFTDWFELGSYHSYLIRDNDGSGDENKRINTCLTLRFDINSNWLVKLEGHKVEGTYGVLPGENETTAEKDWNLYAVKITYGF